jgi:DNA repair protein RadA/Sms
MAKSTTIFVCNSCGHRTPKWLGKCPECEEWNSFAEESVKSNSPRSRQKNSQYQKLVQPITEIAGGEAQRFSTGLGELDKVLGGGLTIGSLVLVGGDPGIGKSTLMLQSMGLAAGKGKKVLYVSGEESPEQIKLRAERLGSLSDTLLISSEICIEDILDLVDKIKPEILVLDSVQTFFTRELTSAPGAIGQIREVAFKVMQEVKPRGIPTFLIGHVTKDGALAGPKALEHIVDTVLYFEGEKNHAYRILRAVKNRFGPTPEMGVFEMCRDGLKPADNPSEIFLSERPEDAPGSVIVSIAEGSRPLFVEVQALASSSSSIGMPRRMATGIDPNRVSLLIAILEKRQGLHLQGEDIFVNIAGGIRISEPAADLGVAAAIAGSFRNVSIDPGIVMMGEIGLAGEVRSILNLDMRLLEAERLGFSKCIVPMLPKNWSQPGEGSLKIKPVKSLNEALEAVF